MRQIHSKIMKEWMFLVTKKVSYGEKNITDMEKAAKHALLRAFLEYNFVSWNLSHNFTVISIKNKAMWLTWPWSTALPLFFLLWL